MSDLFRKSALEKLSSPEQLDRAVVITPPSFWIALLGGFLIILGAVVWGIFGRIPVDVKATGIYVSGDGTSGVYSEIEGIVTEVEVQEGDSIEKGDVVAYVGGKEITDEIASLGERIESVRKVSLESENDAVTADNKDLVDLKTELMALNTTYGQSKKALEEKEKEYNTEKKKVSELKTKADSLKSSYYGSLSSGSDASAQLDYSEAQTELNMRQQLYESAESAYQQAEIQLEQAEAAYSGASDSCNTAVSYAAQAKNNYQQCVNACNEQSAKVEELINNQASAEEIQEAQSKLDELNGKRAQAESENEEAQAQAAAAESAVNEAKSQMDLVNSAKEMAYNNYIDSEANLNNAQSAFDSAKSRYSSSLSSEQSSGISQNMASNEYSQAMSDYSTAKAMLESLEETVKSLKTQTSQAKEDVELKKKQMDISFSSAKSSILDQLQTEMRKYTANLEKYEILSTQSGTVQEIVLDAGSVAGAGAEIIKVKQGSGDKKEALCYMPVGTGKKVVPGMEVMIYPTTVNKQEYGHMTGTVVSVANYVTSQTEMQKKLGDDTLVTAFLNNGPVVEVVCSIKEDSETASGYYWSSKKGADVNLTEGTMLEASIVTERKAPITMVIPYLKEMLSESTSSAEQQTEG